MSIVCPIGEKNIGHPNKIFNKSGTRYYYLLSCTRY